MRASVAVHEDTQLMEAIRSLALEGFRGPGMPAFESREKYRWLRDLGSELWLDTGDAAAAEKVWALELDALTTNNTLVNQVVQTGVMDDLIREGARRIRSQRRDISVHDLVIEIGFLLNARLALNLIQRFGAHVSVELHPSFAFDVRRTMAFARRYHAINPQNFYIKVPLTADGFIAVRLLQSEGIPVNFTLGFSARQNYLATRFASPQFVNIFLGRLNSVVEENALGEPENIGEKATLASYEAVKMLREGSPDIDTLQIAASMRSGGQVSTLAGVDVLTMPPKVAEEYLNSDLSRNDVHRHTSEELQVKLSSGNPVLEREVRRLWEIDAAFIAFVGDAVSMAEQMQVGYDLIELSERHQVNLFHRWTAEDRQKIREKGKIPDVNQWPGAPLDDLMSISALETFAKDQQALDKRIEEIVKGM